MTTAYLHIGLHKTGTSAIQHALFNGREILDRHGILYPSLASNHSHRMFSLFCDLPERFGINIREGLSGEALVNFNHETRETLRHALTCGSYDKVVLSGEEMSRLTASAVQRLHAFFDDCGTSAVVIAYIRPPASAINSLIQEFVKHGGQFPDSPGEFPTPNFRSIKPFVEYFDDSQLLFRPVQGNLDSGFNSVQDFMATIGRPDLAQELPQSRANESFSEIAVRVLERYNRRWPLWIGQPPNRSLNPERAIEPGPTVWAHALQGPPFRLDPAFAQEIVDTQIEDQAWMETVSGLQLHQDPLPRQTTLPLESTLYDELAERLHTLTQAYAQGDEATVRAAAMAMIDAAPAECRIGSALLQAAGKEINP